MPAVTKVEIARGLGPPPVRIALVGLALVYFVMLLKHPEPRGWIRQIAYFSECTGLFTTADTAATEFRLDGWSCERKAWEPLDPRPYFPMRADDKEARFQRIGHFYPGERKVLHALGAYVVAHHAAMDDGVAGAIGGIRMFQVVRPIPEPGSEIERYAYDPLGPVPDGAKRSLWFESSPASLRKACRGGRGSATSPATSSPEGSAEGAAESSVEGSAEGSDAVPSAGSDPWATP